MVLQAVLLGLIFLYGLVARRLERTVITAPILFALGGVIAVFLVPGAREGKVDRGAFLTVAEMGLVLLLFTDASRANLRILKQAKYLPVRLLSIGLLLTIVLGALAAKLLFPSLSIWEAGILGAILAPTDAGLGQVIVTSPRVPERIREALNVEAGLNDGLSVPFFLFFLALANPVGKESANLVHFIVEQLGYGAAIGVAIGLPGGALLALARRKDWAGGHAQQLGVIALPLLCILASNAAGASMFIAAFVAGLCLQIYYKEEDTHSGDFAELMGQFVNYNVFFLFGMIFARAWDLLTVPMIVYAVISLTVVRMAPVALALLGTGMSRATVTFMGWFGPRGLASIVLGLVFLEHESELPGEKTVTLAVVATVFLSVISHGVTAVPGISMYVKRIALLPDGAPEQHGKIG